MTQHTFSLNVRMPPSSSFILTAGGSALTSMPGRSGRVTPGTGEMVSIIAVVTQCTSKNVLLVNVIINPYAHTHSCVIRRCRCEIKLKQILYTHSPCSIHSWSSAAQGLRIAPAELTCTTLGVIDSPIIARMD